MFESALPLSHFCFSVSYPVFVFKLIVLFVFLKSAVPLFVFKSVVPFFASKAVVPFFKSAVLFLVSCPVFCLGQLFFFCFKSLVSFFVFIFCCPVLCLSQLSLFSF